MTKNEFISMLRVRLHGLPPQEIEERLAFYGEAIDDRIEEGLSEKEAVAAMGSLDDIVFEIIGEVPLGRILKERVRPKHRLGAWAIFLIVLASPVCIVLAASAFAVVISLYASAWAVIASAWAAFAALAASALFCLVSAVFAIAEASVPLGLVLIGTAACCAGMAIFAFFGCIWMTRWACILTKRAWISIKKHLMGKEEAK